MYAHKINFLAGESRSRTFRLPPPPRSSMSTSQSSSTVQGSSGDVIVDSRLQNLYASLHSLPDSLPDHPEIYPFADKFALDQYDIEFYGLSQGALNHRLELIFGSQNAGNVITFKGRGQLLEAIVYIFKKYIDGENGENIPLWKWVDDLTHAATSIPRTEPVQQLQIKPSVVKLQKPSSTQCLGGKRQSITQTARKRRSNAAVRAAKEWPHNPANLKDYTQNNGLHGRERDEFLDRLTIACHSKLDTSHLRFAYSSMLVDVKELVPSCKMRCKGLGVTALTTHQKEERANHALLKWLCDCMIPPSAVDCLQWREFVATLDDNVRTASGTTILDSFVTTKAAFIHQESVKLLSQSNNLTLSFDVPSTRDAHLLDGNEATGVSHTAEHLCAVLDKHLREIGPKKFLCIVSDNAGNTRAARTLIEQEYPWIIALQDACHHLSNTAKDIGQLSHFQPCILKMKSVVTHFHTSTFAARHLSALCVLHNVSKALISVGNTRFVSHFYAAQSVLSCLPLILQLLLSEVLDLNLSSPIYWMLDRELVDCFTTELRQLCAILEPFARSIKCLESSHSTPADVYLFWLATIARLHELFKNNSTINGVGLPKLVMEDITGIVNSRHQEMFQSVSGPIYLASFFLDIRFQSSNVFLGLSAISARTTVTPKILASDSNLWRLLPAYTLAGTYLIKLLGRLYNKDPNASPFLHYCSWSNIQVSFQRQLCLFTRGLSPFDRRYNGTQTACKYWENLLSVPSADLLAMVGIVLASIVPNSMTKERTMSTITKLNSPNRASQKVSTLIDMVTIRQHYRREEALTNPTTQLLRPTVRFADLTPAARILTPDLSLAEGEGDSEDTSSNAKYLGGVAGTSPVGSRNYFEVEREDGVFLASKALFEALSDGQSNSQKMTHPLESPTRPEPTRKHQRVDIDSIVF
ncbi:hypothetical protein RhiXN_04067 [Rhizoctonia solani]|uniref:DUF659 domain-containing protein n=1 Tax=Rhizoctonia solani TaxID=456999 RepID=A0A8H8NLN5_9AGAM|nr:uncharacterized protein RhiXN_04067 [Rhizoctonia solani]QRW16066.1 hypothetical protein RhiXN_04067 [Rhizoctonia solani]